MMAWIQFGLIAFLLPSIASNSAMEECRENGMFFCKDTMQCIPKSYICNGENDCLNGEDETVTTCTMGVCHQKHSFLCNVSMQCISKYRICDGDNDCLNGEDESPLACVLKRWCVSERSLSEGCLGECKPGHFGKFCEKTCSKECLNGACNSSSGICTYCNPGYFGKYCQPCSETCLNRLCNSSSGICKDCTTGSFGKNCEKICSKECINGICNRISGICKDCTRTYLESCTLKCGQGCREKDGFPQCDRQSGICLNGCFLNHYGNYCNVSCMNCKENSSVALCNDNGECLYGCKYDYWDKKCNSKCSTNCEGDAYGNRCNSSTGECVNRCTRGWSGIFCGELTDKEKTNSLKTPLIVISAIFTVVVVAVICYVWARKRFISQQNERMKPGRVSQYGVPQWQQQSGSLGRQSSHVYADIHEDTMEQYHYICELNSPDHYDEINVTQYDRDIEIVPSEEFIDDSNSLRNVTDSKGKDKLDSTDESISRRSVTHSYSDPDHACKTEKMNGYNSKRSVVESYSSIERVCTKDNMDLEELCQNNKVEYRRKPAATDSEEGEQIFGDLGQFQVDYIHAIAGEESELLDNE